MEDYINQLNTILSELFLRYSQTIKKPGVLLSGGIDSSLITQFIADYFDSYTILSMGTVYSQDLSYITTMCKHLQKSFEWITLTKEKILTILPTVKSILLKEQIPVTLMQISLASAYFLIFERAKAMGITHIFTGQGPDILFGGYHKYKSVQDVNGEIEKDLPLLELDSKRDKTMARFHGITLINPYLEGQIVAFALSVPSAYKLHNGIEKRILRQFAEKLSLPKAIVRRPKKAFQYSTGIQKIINKII